MPDLDEMIGCTFLMEPHDDGQQHHTGIVQAIEDHKCTINQDPTK